MTDRSQTVEAVEVAERLFEAHVEELLHRPRREPVATGLLTGKALALDDQDAVPSLRQPVRRRRACGSGTDDQNVPLGRTVRAQAFGRRCRTWP